MYQHLPASDLNDVRSIVLAETTIPLCAGCGSSFQRTGRNQSYCTLACRRAATIDKRRETVRRWRQSNAGNPSPQRSPADPKPCECCGVDFLPKRRKDQRFCSPACHDKAWNDARVAQRQETPRHLDVGKCKVCGAEFSRNVREGRPRQFCSRACKAREHHAVEEAARQIKRQARLPLCAICGEKCKKTDVKTCSRACWYKLFLKNHPGGHHRRARARGAATERISIIKVFERDNWRCHICGCETPKSLRGTHHPQAPELDHIIPISRGGPHLLSNVACACFRCNRSKGPRSSPKSLPPRREPAPRPLTGSFA